MAKMDKKVKEIWVEALRSGSYRQDEGVMCNKILGKGTEHKKFCCLGVLRHCMLGIDANPDELANHFPDVFNDYENHYRAETKLLDEERELFGIGTKEQSKLIDMNDDLGLKFNQIAKYIEENM